MDSAIKPSYAMCATSTNGYLGIDANIAQLHVTVGRAATITKGLSVRVGWSPGCQRQRAAFSCRSLLCLATQLAFRRSVRRAALGSPKRVPLFSGCLQAVVDECFREDSRCCEQQRKTSIHRKLGLDGFP